MQRKLLFCIPLFLFFLAGCTPEPKDNADMFSAMPNTSVLILESNNLYESFKEIKQTDVFTEIDSLPSVVAYGFDLAEITSLFPEDSIETFFEDTPFLVSLALSGAKKYSLLYATKAKANWQNKLAAKLKKHYKLSSFTYANQTITKVEAQSNFYFCAINGLLLGSGNKALLEESLRQTISGFNLKDNPDFNKLYETANKKEQANIYVNLKEISRYFNTFFPNGETGFLTKLGSWTELDLELLNKEVLLSGLTLIPTNEQRFLNSFQNSEAQPSEAFTILPTNFSSSISYTFNNAEKWHRAYAELEQEKGNATRVLDFESTINKRFNIKADAHLLFWIDNEVGTFKGGNSSDEHAHVAFLKYRDKDQAIKSMELLADSSFILGYRGVIIKRLAINNPHRAYFGTLFSGFAKPYFFEYAGFILYTSNLSSAKSLLDEYLSGNILSNDESFEDFTNMLTENAHIHCLAAGSGLLRTITRTLPEKEQDEFKKQTKRLQNFNYAGAQLTVKNDAAYTNLYINHNPPKKEKVTRLWSTVLEAPALSAPQFVTNHGNQKGEILIQDANFKLYLIDRQGKILWSKLLDGALMGNVHQIDIFKNKKLQYVFNTFSKVYVLDRLGRDVENFPLNLKKPATAAMAVFDYDNNRNYRLIIPTGDNLLNYDVNGKPVDGWKFMPNKSPILLAPQLINVGSKEVITVYTENGVLRFLYRNGKERFKKQSVANLQGKLFYYKGKTLEKTQLVSLTKNGKLAYVSINSGNEELPIDAENEADYYMYFDEKNIYTADEKLVNRNTTYPWTVELKGDISATPKVMIFRGDFYAAAFSETAEEISLFNKKGELLEGFPIFAQGTFDMGSLNRNSVINIVTTMKDGTVVCYGVF